MAKTLKEKVKDRMDESQMSILELSRQTGIPSARMYKWYREDLNPKSYDEKILEKWLNGEVIPNVPRETEPEIPTVDAINGIVESNKVLSDANKTLADANKALADGNKALADAHLILAKGNEELIQILKGMVSLQRSGSAPLAPLDPSTNKGSEGSQPAKWDKTRTTEG